MSNKTGKTPQALDQVTRLMKGISDALHDASAKTADSNRQITERVMQQAEENAKQLFDTLQAMAATRNPAEATKIYTDFLATSTQKHASQLLEMGQIMTKASKETWGPVAEAIKTAASSKAQQRRAHRERPDRAIGNCRSYNDAWQSVRPLGTGVKRRSS